MSILSRKSTNAFIYSSTINASSYITGALHCSEVAWCAWISISLHMQSLERNATSAMAYNISIRVDLCLD